MKPSARKQGSGGLLDNPVSRIRYVGLRRPGETDEQTQARLYREQMRRRGRRVRV